MAAGRAPPAADVQSGEEEHAATGGRCLVLATYNEPGGLRTANQLGSTG